MKKHEAHGRPGAMPAGLPSGAREGLSGNAGEAERAGQEIHELRERFRALHEASFGGIAIHDKGIILDCNKGLSDITGYSVNELIDMDGLLLIAPAWRDHVMHRIAGGYDKAYDVEGLRKDGSVYPLEIRGKNIPYRGRTVRVTEFRDITDRKVAQQRVQESEERYRLLFQSSIDGILLTRPDGAIIAANPAACRILERTEEEIIRAGRQGIVDPDDPRVGNALEKRLHTGSFRGEVRFRRKDGRVFPAEISSVVMKDRTGDTQSSLIFRDATDLKRAQDLLRQANEELEQRVKDATREIRNTNRVLEERTELLEKIVNNIPVMLVIIDPVGRARFVNPELERRSGWTREEMDHVDVIRASYPDPEKYNEVYDFIMESRPGWRDFESVSKSGEKFPSSWATVRLSDGSNLGIGIDITQRQKMEQSLKRLAAAIDQAGDGIMLLSTEAVIEYVNPALERQYGYSKDELLGRTVRVLGEDAYESYREIFERIRTDKKVRSQRRTRRKKGGEPFEAYLTVSPVLDSKGNIMNFVSVGRDITQEVLFQQNLIQSQKLEAIGALAGGVAHDLKNILTPILLNTEMALDDVGHAHPVRTLLEEVLEAARMGKDFVNQILTFSKSAPPHKKRVDIAAVTRDTLSFLRSSLPSNIEIREHIDEECTETLADPTQIKQVLINFGSNAGYAMGHRGGLLDISLKHVNLDERSARQRSLDLKPGPYIRITVRDTGMGIDEQTLEHIFEPFFTTKPKGEGTGMGLTVAHGIVKNHQGAVTVESTPGQGTTFTVYLPRIPDTCR